jgi:hypothetical protein
MQLKLRFRSVLPGVLSGTNIDAVISALKAGS